MTVHAIERARERYGIKLELHELAEAEQRIEGGDSLLVTGKGQDDQIHIMRIKGKAVRVVFVVSQRRIITFLPYEVPHYRPRPMALAMYREEEHRQERRCTGANR